jgi:molecular chaperone IbpA
MRQFDLSPLFRASVGFDRLSTLLESATRLSDEAASYPPYNIEKRGEDQYRVSVAVAGFTRDELDVNVENGTLTVRGKAKDETEPQTVIYRGIARRAFERRFQLAEHIHVTGANLENGLLSVDLVREVPEAKKPRTIAIGSGVPAGQTIEHSRQAA